MKIKLSRLLRMIDMAMVEQSLLILDNMPYVTNINPHKEGTIRHKRFEIHYKRGVKRATLARKELEFHLEEKYFII